jgi:hypothetical protein
MLDSLEGVCPGQAQFEHPVTSVLFSKCRSCALRAGLPHWAWAGAGERAAGAPRAGPADRVPVVADEPLDAPGHSHVIRCWGGSVSGGGRHGHAIAADVDGGLASGDRGVEGDAADEPCCGAEVVEVEGSTHAVAVELPARQGADLLFLNGGHARLPLRSSLTRSVGRDVLQEDQS